MSAGDCPSFSAIVCGVAPRTNCSTRSAGVAGVRAGAGAGLPPAPPRRDRRRRPSPAAATVGGARAARLRRRVGHRLHDAASPRPLWLGLAGRGRRLEHLAALAGPWRWPCPRSRAAAGPGPRARWRRPTRPVTPICSRVASELLARDPQFLRQFVNPHTLLSLVPIALLSLAAASADSPVRSARSNALVRIARLDASGVAVHVRPAAGRRPATDRRRRSRPSDDAPRGSGRASAPSAGTRRTSARASTPRTRRLRRQPRPVCVDRRRPQRGGSGARPPPRARLRDRPRPRPARPRPARRARRRRARLVARPASRT